jgi:hypothetical protein
VFSRWLHHHWCPCHGKRRSQVSYTSFTWAECYHCTSSRNGGKF